MSKKITTIVVSIIFLVSTVTLLADEKADEEKASALQKELENKQPSDLEQTPQPAEPEQSPAARRRIRARRDEQLDIDVVQRRNRADQPQQPTRQQVPERPGRVAQLQNRWFNALKEAYREGNMDRIGRLIDRMDQLRNQMAGRPESAQQMRPLERQGRRADQDYQPQGRMRNFRGQSRYRGPSNEAPAFHRQFRREHHGGFRMQDMPYRQFQSPAAPLHQGYCENCNCERCRQLRARQQWRHHPPMIEGRIPDRFGPYEEEGFQQRRFHRQEPWQQQQWQPKENIPENEESDFDWDW